MIFVVYSSRMEYKTVLFSVGSQRGPTLLYEVQNNGLHKRERGHNIINIQREFKRAERQWRLEIPPGDKWRAN